MEKDFITSNAMLSAYLSKNNDDCLDLMSHFVLYLLPNVGEYVDCSEISSELKSCFGFDNILENVIIRIIQRIYKKKEYLRKEKDKYFVKKQYDRDKFESKRFEISNRIDDLSKKLSEFIEDNNYESNVTTEKAKEYITVFLRTYNYCFDKIIEYKKITVDSQANRSNFWVARFIIFVYEKDVNTFNSFLEIVKGSLAAKAVAFWGGEKVEERKKLKNTDFYFDTRLLINIMEFGEENENKATLQLKDLIEKNGGRVKTFETYVEEFRGILTKYIKSPKDRLGLSLDALRKGGYSLEYIRQIKESLESHLKQRNVEIVYRPDASIPIEKLDWPVGIMELKKYLSDYVTYKEGERGQKSLDNDANTLEAISIIRYELQGKTSIEDCRAIFVTKNLDLIYAAHKYFQDNQMGHGIELVVSDVELTAWLWLNYCRNNNIVPELNLLENAYTACYPTSAVIQEFQKNIDIMRQENKLTEEQAAVIRSGNIDLRTLVDKTNNSGDAVTEIAVTEVVDAYFEKLETNAWKKLDKQKKDADKEILERMDDLKKEEKKIQRQRKELMDKEKSLMLYEENVKRKEKREKDKFREYQLEQVNKNAEAKKQRVKKVGKVICGVIVALIVIFSVAGMYYSFKEQNNFLNVKTIASTIAFILGGLGSLEMIMKLNGLLTRTVDRIAAKVFQNQYSKYMNSFQLSDEDELK